MDATKIQVCHNHRIKRYKVFKGIDIALTAMVDSTTIGLSPISSVNAVLLP
jgi:hypothetical protein